MGETSVFETISREYYSLTASEKKTADYLMAHQEESQFMSIAELAEECGETQPAAEQESAPQPEPSDENQSDKS